MFVDLVERYFQDRGLPALVGDGVVSAPMGQGREHMQLGLLNLAQVCHAADRSQWPRLVEAHFQLVDTLAGQRTAFEPVAGLEQVRDQLAVRIWPEEILGSLRSENLIWREDIPGTVSALVLDMPTSVRTIKPEEANGWDKGIDELFSLALENVYRKYPPDISQHEINGAGMVLLTGESFFIASHALLLDRYSQCLGPHGAIVGLPHRHVVLCHPIRDGGVVPALNSMMPAVIGMEKEGPGSITPSLYWYHDRQFVNLPFETGQDQIRFMPPEEFVDVLRELTG